MPACAARSYSRIQALRVAAVRSQTKTWRATFTAAGRSAAFLGARPTFGVGGAGGFPSCATANGEPVATGGAGEGAGVAAVGSAGA